MGVRKNLFWTDRKSCFVTLVPYVNEKKAWQQNRLAPVPMHTGVCITQDEPKKPDIHTFYENAKYRLDPADLD